VSRIQSTPSQQRQRFRHLDTVQQRKSAIYEFLILCPPFFSFALSLSASVCNQEEEEPERLHEETRNRKNILLSYKQQQNKSFRDTIQGSTRRDTYYNLSQANTIAELLFGIHTLIPPPD
jgi:hypothetical protein